MRSLWYFSSVVIVLSEYEGEDGNKENVFVQSERAGIPYVTVNDHMTA